MANLLSSVDILRTKAERPSAGLMLGAKWPTPGLCRVASIPSCCRGHPRLPPTPAPLAHAGGGRRDDRCLARAASTAVFLRSSFSSSGVASSRFLREEQPEATSRLSFWLLLLRVTRERQPATSRASRCSWLVISRRETKVHPLALSSRSPAADQTIRSIPADVRLWHCLRLTSSSPGKSTSRHESIRRLHSARERCFSSGQSAVTVCRLLQLATLTVSR
mmetsp:Transcript_37242/g.105078  ORF Transcript_37242/g.105078 Transcript_37242/m.105078 type:complete len:220 (-) Transcript_37242:374-1033(-)